MQGGLVPGGNPGDSNSRLENHFMVANPTTWMGRKPKVQEPIGTFTESPYGHDGEVVTIWDRAGMESDLPDH
eukprot:11122085-Karenia_brevis.AAC.1